MDSRLSASAALVSKTCPAVVGPPTDTSLILNRLAASDVVDLISLAWAVPESLFSAWRIL
jgi:hypothetical protein